MNPAGVDRPHQPSSADVDGEKQRRVEANLSMFTSQIDTKILLPHLKPCLPDKHFTVVRKQCGEQSLLTRVQVNQLLWKYLKRAPGWWQCLELALDTCGPTDLLRIMQG